MKNRHPVLFPPLIFNVYKPKGISSYDVVRHFKRNLPQGFGKIGHFGTLDPFAEGVLMIGTGGAARLNDFIHEYLPKTYLAMGKLGEETPTGDPTSEIVQKDESAYLVKEISQFSKDFIDERAKSRFLGEYLQTPHKYSATKFMGKNLHEWAREGVDVKKDAVARTIYKIEVVDYKFPELTLRACVSSGTYIRTLFTELAHDLGTLGHLLTLKRESVGHIHAGEALRENTWPTDRNPEFMKQGIPVQEVLNFGSLTLNEDEVKIFRNGGFLRTLSDLRGEIESPYRWLQDENKKLLGLGEWKSETELRPKINFCSEVPSESSSGHNPQ
jgi:tRNA pseudouridine55 synthase